MAPKKEAWNYAQVRESRTRSLKFMRKTVISCPDNYFKTVRFQQNTKYVKILLLACGFLCIYA